MSNARMNGSPKRALLVAAAAALFAAIVAVQTTLNGAEAPADDDQAIVHVLNRIGFGPRPGDLERVRQIGVRAYIDQQLHPERIADDALAARLTGLPTLGMSSRDIAEQYERPLMEARRERKQDAAAQPPDAPPLPKPKNPDGQQANQPLLDLSQQKVLRAVYSDR